MSSNLIKKEEESIMERKGMSPHERLLKCFSHAGHKMLSLHEQDNISEFVLHYLCDEDCLNLSKAAYFVDNHDFDCLKGVAGFDKLERYRKGPVWDQPEEFSSHMRQSSFNNKVRQVSHASTLHPFKTEHALIRKLASDLAIDKPEFYVWDIKYDNHALLIFEALPDSALADKEMLKSLCLLGFCPIN